MVRYYITVVVWISLVLPVWWYERFTDELVSDYQVIVRDCELSQRTWCSEANTQAIVTVDPILDAIRNLLEWSDTIKKDKVITQIEAIIPFLQIQADKQATQSKQFMAERLIAWFTDMLQEIERRALTLFVDAASIQGSVKQDMLWNPVYHEVRQALIRQLIAKGFDRFVTKPYAYGLWMVTTDDANWKQWSIGQSILTDDSLDDYLNDFLKKEGNHWKDIRIDPEVYTAREWLYLFKDASDLETLNYQVVSHRTRKNTDAEYRRYNIAKAFEEIGHVRVLNPGDTISYLWDSNFDMVEQEKYKTGKAIFLDEEIESYGGGLCGGSTAIYQWTFLNKSLEFTKRNHSKRYTSLYTATINWEEQSMPGIDSTIYSPNLDLKVTNTASYPILMVMNYDGEYGATEEIFTMSPNYSDQWEYQFVQSWNKNYTLKQQWWEDRAVVGKCYEWEINGELSTRCYKEVF